MSSLSEDGRYFSILSMNQKDLRLDCKLKINFVRHTFSLFIYHGKFGDPTSLLILDVFSFLNFNKYPISSDWLFVTQIIVTDMTHNLPLFWRKQNRHYILIDPGDIYWSFGLSSSISHLLTIFLLNKNVYLNAARGHQSVSSLFQLQNIRFIKKSFDGNLF